MFSKKLNNGTVLKYFKEISDIPRGSGNEKDISDYFVQLAKKNGLNVIQDEALNVLIKKPATKGFENAPTVIIQGHLDMVCEKNKGIKHDFKKDPLKLRVIDDMIYATDTTLGADNGVALVYALALIQAQDIKHPNLEILLTTEEETTMGGIKAVDENLLEGKILINLDSEEEGKLLVSSAGGIDIKQVLPIEWDTIDETLQGYKISIKGLQGGHSGMAIDKGRGNSNKLIGRVLNYLNENINFYVYKINGGSKVNAIPREAEITILVDNNLEEKLERHLEEIEHILKNEFSVSDQDMCIKLEKVSEKCKKAFSKETKEKFIDSLILIPNGVQTMSMEIPGLVESSNNLGIVYTDDDNVFFESEIRSAVKSLKLEILNRVKSLAKLLGCQFYTGIEYLEWTYDARSKIRRLCEDVYKKKFGKNPEIVACHAGIECSILIDKIPGLDAISMGPNMYDAHNPNEHVSISSTIKTWEYLLEVLEEIRNY